MNTILEEEIPKHRRKKGRKHFAIECRLTPEGLERKVREYRTRIEGDLKWLGGYSKYEKLRDAERALEGMNKRKNSSTYWGDYYRDREYRIIKK